MRSKIDYLLPVCVACECNNHDVLKVSADLNVMYQPESPLAAIRLNSAPGFP